MPNQKYLSIDDVFLNELTRESILPGFYDYWLENNKGYFLFDVNLGYNINKILDYFPCCKKYHQYRIYGASG